MSQNNFPANQHHRFTKGRVATSLDQLTSIRIDDLLSHKGWHKLFVADDPVLVWLEGLLAECRNYYDVEEISPTCV